MGLTFSSLFELVIKNPRDHKDHVVALVVRLTGLDNPNGELYTMKLLLI